uniref:Uncharacterized protein n=1 Tax=Arundo donax TaxID=35708 RepID=A0A0A9CXN3_ARUDO
MWPRCIHTHFNYIIEVILSYCGYYKSWHHLCSTFIISSFHFCCWPVQDVIECF